MNKKNDTPRQLHKRGKLLKRGYWTGAAAVLMLCVLATPAFAAGSDPLTIVNNLSDFIFSIIKALGRHHPRLGHCAGGYVHPVPRCQPENTGFSVSVRRPADRLCKGDPDRHWCDLKRKPGELRVAILPVA
jgi:hypothetical protein